jgi:membrane protease YdiL (CAAX protease family)
MLLTDGSNDAASTAAAAPRPWGYVATFAWLLLAAVLAIAASVAVLALTSRQRLEDAADLMSDGPLVSELTLASTAVEIGVVALAARLACWRPADYLALVIPDARWALIPVVSMAVFLLAYDALTSLLSHDVVSPFQLDTYRSARAAGLLPMLWLAFVIVAPLGEEIVFRGFLYRGWAQSPRTIGPAIAVISALWAMLHVQYDWFGILQIFLLGLLLGWARWRSGSTLLAFVLHGLANAWAMIETAMTIG